MKKIVAVIYKATNILNDKVYIGCTTKTLDQRINKHLDAIKYYKSNLYFHRAIRRLGIKNFRFEILENCFTKIESHNQEQFYINLYKSNNKKYGYNQASGGIGSSGYKFTEAQRNYTSLKTKEAMKNPKIRKILIINGKKVHSNPIIRQKFLINNKIAQGKPQAIENNSTAQRGLWKVWKERHEFIIKNLKLFCQENNLSYAAMKFINQGKQKQHKGWQCKLIERYGINQ